MRLQPLWNRLYDRVGRDHAFLQHALRHSARACRWEARQLAAHGRTLARAVEKPQPAPVTPAALAMPTCACTSRAKHATPEPQARLFSQTPFLHTTSPLLKKPALQREQREPV